MADDLFALKVKGTSQEQAPNQGSTSESVPTAPETTQQSQHMGGRSRGNIGPISAAVPSGPLTNPPTALTATANQNVPEALDQKLEIRCTQKTLERFLTIRAKYKSHGDALNSLMDFYTQNGGDRAMVPLRGRVV